MDSPRPPLRLAVLISGGGTTLRNLIERIDAGSLDASITLVVSSNSLAGGLEFARRAKIPTFIRTRQRDELAENFSSEIFQACRDADAQLVVMAGFLKHVLIPDDFAGRVMNIHPSLIPAFCGQGFYGSRVHQAALEYGVKVSGCAVHFVDNQYDHGPIICWRTWEAAYVCTSDALKQSVSVCCYISNSVRSVNLAKGVNLLEFS